MREAIETLGQRLARLRERAGLSQPALASAAGVPVWSLRNWEQDRREPLATAVAKLCRALKISADELLGDIGRLQETGPTEEPDPH